MTSGKRRSRAFAALSASCALLFLAILAVQRFAGRAIVRAANEGRLSEALERWFQIQGGMPLQRMMDRVDDRFGGVAALIAGVWALVAVVVLARRLRPRALWVPAAVLAWWVAFELVAAPFLVETLYLQHYHIVRDPDHRPEGWGKAWNSDALRGTPEPEEFTDETFNLVFLGDSFTYGYRLEAPQAFPALVGRLVADARPELDVRVANFGWTSSSPLLSLRRLRDIGERYRPDLVVLCVDMTDFHDDIRWRNMLDRRGLYTLYDKLPISVKVLDAVVPDAFARVVAWSVGGSPVPRYFITEAPLEETRRWMQPLADNVAEIDRWCADHGAEFVLVVLPRAYQYSEREAPENWEADRYTVLGPYSAEPFRFFEELAPSAPYPIVPLLDDFRETHVFPTCFRDDSHWNPSGHRVAADAIARALAPAVDRIAGR